MVRVPRARIEDDAGKVTEWRSKALPRYQRLTRKAEALIAAVHLAGTNTRRVKRALFGLFEGAVSKDVVSRAWRKVKVDWDAWCARSLADEDIVRPILDGTVIKTRLDRKATNISVLAGRPSRLSLTCCTHPTSGAGGSGTISGLGDRSVNRSIGGQWGQRARGPVEATCRTGARAGGAPDVRYRGGADDAMRLPVGDRLDGHHAPARAASPQPSGIGPAIWMDPEDHALTPSNGRVPGSRAFIGAQAGLVAQGNFLGAQAMDVASVRAAFADPHDEAIAQIELTPYACNAMASFDRDVS